MATVASWESVSRRREHGQIPKPGGVVDPTRCPRTAADHRPGSRGTGRCAAGALARAASWPRKRRAARRRTPGRSTLLSGGPAVCPTCGGHFEAFKCTLDGRLRLRHPTPQARRLHEHAGAAHRRRPTTPCSSIVEGEALGTAFIEELLPLVDTTPDARPPCTAERERLHARSTDLRRVVAAGHAGRHHRAAIREQLTGARSPSSTHSSGTPRPRRRTSRQLRAALEQRADEWKADLRAEPTVARRLLRRLVGPLTLWDAAEPGGRRGVGNDADAGVAGRACHLYR